MAVLKWRQSILTLTSESGDALGKRIGAAVDSELKKARTADGAREDLDLLNSKIYKQLVKLLRQVDLFKGDENNKGLRASDLDEIIKVMEIEQFDQDQLVFNINDYGDKFYIILSGEVTVLIPNDQIKDWHN